MNQENINLHVNGRNIVKQYLFIVSRQEIPYKYLNVFSFDGGITLLLESECHHFSDQFYKPVSVLQKNLGLQA